MQHDKDDPKGYYAVLGLSSIASDEQIKATYRRRAMSLHPDRNPGTDTTQAFQFLNEAHDVLSDPISRAEYDRFASESIGPTDFAQGMPEPITCSVCSKVSAQPRVVILRSVKSFLLVTIRKPIVGVFCSDCAQKQSLKASATSWLLGWWGFPWGPIYTAQALVTNMFGGAHPPLENAKMLGYQAYYFYTAGRKDLAHSIAESALKFAQKIPTTIGRKGEAELERESLIHRLEGFIGELGHASQANKLRSSWGLLHARLLIHLGAIAIVAGGIALAIANAPSSHYSPPRGPMPYSAQTIPTGQAVNGKTSTSTLQNPPSKKAAYTQPKTAPNGRPWPTTAGYLVGEPQTHKTGLSEVTIDNSQNSSAVLLKLVALEGAVARPARQVFIPARSQFTIKSLTAGSYDIRYRDLSTGELSRSDSMRLTETKTYQGTNYSVMTLTLYKVANGNTSTYGLSEEEF